MNDLPDDTAAPGPGPDGAGHLLLLAGVGGHSPEDALDSLSRLTSRVSVAFVDAWTDATPVEQDWRRRRLAGEFLVASDLDTCVDLVEQAHARTPFDGVVTYSELLLRPQAEIAARLGLPGNPVAAVRRAQSKVEQRRAFTVAGVPAPEHAVVAQAADIPGAARRVGLPAVFKPSLGAGSLGVVGVASVAQAQEAFARMLAAAGGPFLQTDDLALLEEHVPVEGGAGSPYADYCSVESLLSHGSLLHVAVTDRLRLRHGFVEEGLVLPSHLPAAVRRAACECATAAIRALGLTTGAVHTEVALGPNGPQVIEVNARAGGPVPVLLETAAGYDYAAEAARVALGLEPAPPRPFHRTAYMRFLPTPPGEWEVRGATPTADILAACPELVYFSSRCPAGRVLRSEVDLHVASYVLAAPTFDDARRLAALVEERFALDLVRRSDGTTWRSGAASR